MLETLAALVIMVDAQSDHLFNETESVFATEMCSEDILKPCAVTGQYYSCRQCTCPTTYYYKIQTSGTKTYEGCFSCVTCGTNQYISNCVTSSGSCAACENCAAGTYRTGCGGKSPGSCSPCPPGYYCSGVSGTQPIQCKTISSCADINQYVKSCTATSDSVCTNCADNFAKPSDSYWVAGGDTCTWACNIGPPAYFKNSKNLCQQCKVPPDCQTGEYITKCNANEDGLCTSCDNKPELNSYYTDKSNTYLPECPWSCNAGYEIKGSFCEACPQGSYAKKETTDAWSVEVALTHHLPLPVSVPLVRQAHMPRHYIIIKLLGPHPAQHAFRESTRQIMHPLLVHIAIQPVTRLV